MTPKRIVVSLLTEDQEFQRMQAADARAAAAAADVGVDVVFAENNAVLQIQQLFREIHARGVPRPDALVVEALTGEGLERVARNAVAGGIGWVLLNWRIGYLETLRKQHPEVLVGSVAVDEHEIGRIQARQCRALAPQGGDVLCLQGPADSTTAQGRLEGLREGLAGSSELKILNGDWTEASGERAVGSWLRLKTSEGFRPVVVASQNDAMAVGARRVLAERGDERARVPFVGCDGLPEGGQVLVERGELAATIVKPTTAGAAVTLAARLLAADDQQRRLVPVDVVLTPRSFPPLERLVARPPVGPGR